MKKKLQAQDPTIELIKFYPSQGPEKGLKYVRSIAEDFSLPHGGQGFLYEHDLNYHLISTLLMPDKLKQGLRVRAQLLMELRKFLEKNPPKDPKLRDFLKYFDTDVLNKATSHFDTVGNLAHAVYGTDPGNGVKIIREMFFKNESPVAYLRTLMKEARPPEVYVPRIEQYEQAVDKMLDQFEKTVDKKLLEADLPPEWFSDRNALLFDARANIARFEVLLGTSEGTH
ncbi:hypothetical protein K2X30_07315 [bacterium]|nr:hypothetical protein [bacterium]